MKIAYIMSRFPVITETFILLEMAEVLRQGVAVRVYPLIRQHEAVQHHEVRELLPYTRFIPFFSAQVLWANLIMLVTRPGRYLRTLAALVTGPISPFSGRIKTLTLFPKSMAIAWQVEKQGIDLVHAHYATFPSTTAWLIYRMTGIPFTYTVHASDIHVHDHLLKVKVREAVRTVAISAYNRDFILDRVGAELRHKITIIHCGVQVEQYRADGADCRERKGGKSSTRQIICVGSFKEYKGHVYLIEACRLLEEKGIDFVCHLVGDGGLRPDIESRISRLKLADRVIIHGACPRDQVIEMLKKADIGVLASVQSARGDREGIPVALMEAMAAGLPVVGSDLSGIPELIEHRQTGLLAAPRDSESLAAALTELCLRPDLCRLLGSRGQAKVNRDFAMAKCVEQLIALWTTGVCKGPDQPDG